MASYNLNLKGISKIKKALGNKALYKNIGSTAVSEIKRTIARGYSPVKGEGKFKPYSRSYLNQINNGYGMPGRYGKKPLPVNMELSGKMMNSLKYSVKAGFISIFFTDKKAVYHNTEGAGRSKVIRRLLPTEPGEEPSTRIKSKIKEELTKIRNYLVKLGNSA